MDVVASIINFGVVVFILWFFGRKPIMGFLGQRRTTVETELAESHRLYDKATKDLAHWETQWRQKEKQIEGQLSEAKLVLEKQKKALLEFSEQEKQRIIRETELAIKTQWVAARKQLGEDFLNGSIRVSRAFLERNLKEEDHVKLVKDSLELVNGRQV